MASVEEITNIIKLIMQFATGGWPTWIAGIIALILVVAGSWYLKKVRNDIAKQETEKQKIEDQASNKTENQQISDGAQSANDAVDEVRKQNPDTDKKPRHR